MGKAAKTFTVLAIIAILSLGVWLVARIIKTREFKMNCTQYLKRAADASSVETAKEELAKAISYAEDNDLTEGVVSIFLHQPKNDVEYWYKNMTEAYKMLENLPEDATPLEESNVLMRFRESLTDETDSGVSVTRPDGIAIYPNNVAYCLWGVLSLILFIVFVAMACVAYEKSWD